MAYFGERRRPGETTYSHKTVVEDFVPSSAWTEDANGHYLLVDLPDFKQEQVKLQVGTSGNVTVSGERLTNDKSRTICFEKTFKLPPNSDIDEITGKFEGEILYVTVPKLVQVEKRQQEFPKRETENISSSGSATEEIKEESSLHHRHNDENVNRDPTHVHGKEEDDDNNAKLDHESRPEKKKMDCSRVDGFCKEDEEKWAKETSQLQWPIKILKENKGIVLTAMIAFSLGAYVSRKFGPALTVAEDDTL